MRQFSKLYNMIPHVTITLICWPGYNNMWLHGENELHISGMIHDFAS